MSSAKRSAADDQTEGPSSKMQIDKSVDHFSRLPVEVIEHIFNFLGVEGLMPCTLVNQHFSKVISGSRKFMSRFTLRINGYLQLDNILKGMATLRRRYQKFSFLNMDHCQMESIIARLDANLKNATEVNIFSSEAPKSRQLLSCFPNVVKLTLGYFGSTETFSPTMFPKLKHLKLYDGVNVRIAPGIWNLDTLDVPFKRSKANQLKKLLESQRSLDTLRFDCGSYSDVQDFQLNLHPELKIRRLLVDSSIISAQIIPATLQFGGKVECLKYFGDCSKENLLKVLQHYNTVKALSLRKLPENESFYGTATVNTELTELVIEAVINCKALLGVFIIFPNLGKLSIKASRLDISEPMHEELSRLRWNLNQLERLTVASGFGCNIAVFKELAPKITDLYLSLDFFRTFKSLKVVCTNVNLLSIEGDQGSNMSLDPNKILECFPKLKTLKLGSNVFDVFTPNLLIQAIKDKAKNLQSLKAPKDLLRALNQEARLLGIGGLSITSVDDELDFKIVNMGDFEYE